MRDQLDMESARGTTSLNKTYGILLTFNVLCRDSYLGMIKDI